MTSPDRLVAWMRMRDGIAHSSTIVAAGFTRYVIERAVADMRIRRVRRSWLVTPECPDSLLTAATAGGRVTCVSAAERPGLWTPAHEGLHLAVHSHGSRYEPDGGVIHWAQPPVALPRTEPREHVLNILFHVARCVGRSEALAVWESAIRKQRVDAPLLERIQWRSSRASEIASIASAASDAGTETQFRFLMNQIGVEVRQQVWIDGHPVDGLVGESLVVQVDGFAHHSSPADRRRDVRADARLALRGFSVFRFDYQQVFFDPDHVVSTIQTAMAQGLHRR